MVYVLLIFTSSIPHINISCYMFSMIDSLIDIFDVLVRES